MKSPLPLAAAVGGILLLAGCARDAADGGRPGLLLGDAEASRVRAALGSSPLLDRSFAEARRTVDSALARPIDVPPPGEAGGYEHERHKQNYREVRLAGMLHAVTGEERYAFFVRDMLLRYAAIYPALGPHPKAHIQAPGKLFHQMLNEAVWLVHVSQGYDCVRAALAPKDRETIEANVFRPMVEWFTGRNGKEFDRIHNHGTWSVASVGMAGMILGDTALVSMALHGTRRDGTGGFLKQIDLLFSPDGYYMEGPYYARYALMPFFYFAEALERHRPGLRIYEYRDRALRKALRSALATAFPNGVFPPINDASRTMDLRAEETAVATCLAYLRYGADENLLAAIHEQRSVLLNDAGIAASRDLAARQEPPVAAWGSVEFTDGFDGTRGGLGILRTTSGDGAREGAPPPPGARGGATTMLLMKYGVHGEGHGHFDKLTYILFDQGRDVVPDYGYARWINIEPKFGGRYLPENDSYAMTTVAHNTVTVDGRVQNGGDMHAAERVWGERHFFDASDPAVQAMSARADGHYPGVRMQRTMFLVRDAGTEHPVVIDLFRLASAAPRRYDYPLHFRGQPIILPAGMKGATASLAALGTEGGYEHLWNEGEARSDSGVAFTWLDGGRYYTLTAAGAPGTTVVMARLGAGDPNWNLIPERALILRRRAADHLFAAVIEPHGFFDESKEKSSNARPSVREVRVLASDEAASVVEVCWKDGRTWRAAVWNGDDGAGEHAVRMGAATLTWSGPWRVWR